MRKQKRSALVASASLPFSSAASCALSRAGFTVSRRAPSCADVLKLVQLTKPDILIVDSILVDMNGVRCTRTIKRRFPGCKIILLLTNRSYVEAAGAIRSGADGISARDDFLSLTERIVCTVLAGAYWLGPSVKRLPAARPSVRWSSNRQARNFRLKAALLIAVLFLLASFSIIPLLNLLSLTDQCQFKFVRSYI
jgi:DNA-binding NarL/FixJ family response regulator